MAPPRPESTGASTYWQNLAVAVDAGQLFLNEEAAKKCHAACVVYLAKLDIHKESAQNLARVEGYGDFKSGQELADIFSKKAVGGEDNMVDVLESHIQVVKDMQAVFQKFFTVYDDTEQDNSIAIGQAGPK
ncbi:MAG: hypothetical protein ACSLE8_02130 [Rhodococcus sp. (in: high G+C Gram-positive bacteria)]